MVCASRGAPNAFEQQMVIGCEDLIEQTPIDLLCRVLTALGLQDLAPWLLGPYNEFLEFIDKDENRDHLETLSFDNAEADERFRWIRTKIGREFRDALADLFFDHRSVLAELTKRHGLF